MQQLKKLKEGEDQVNIAFSENCTDHGFMFFCSLRGDC